MIRRGCNVCFVPIAAVRPCRMSSYGTRMGVDDLSPKLRLVRDGLRTVRASRITTKVKITLGETAHNSKADVTAFDWG
jgi:hypothetical protein